MKACQYLPATVALSAVLFLVAVLPACNMTPVTPEGRIRKAITQELDKEIKARMPVIDDFKFDSYYVFSGDNVTLSWKVRQSDNITIDNGIGGVEASGSMKFVPPALGRYTYTVTAVNKYGKVTKPTGIDVMDETKPPGILLEVSPTTLQSGKMARIEWSTSAARDVTIDNGIGPSK